MKLRAGQGRGLCTKDVGIRIDFIIVLGGGRAIHGGWQCSKPGFPHKCYGLSLLDG